MIVLDSCGWIAWLTDDARSSGYAAWLRGPADEVVVPALVLYEVTRWVDRRQGEQRAREIAALLRSRRVVPLDDHVALLAVRLARLHRLATADSIVYAHAQALGIELATSDAALQHLPSVLFVAAA